MPADEDESNNHEQRNQHRILEFARSAAVQSAANLLEHVADAQRARRKMEATFGDDAQGSPKDDADKNSDMLFDMLRLNAHFLNEAAKLGHRYKDIAGRALENIYTKVAPKTRAPSAQQLFFKTGQLTRDFAVENDVDAHEKHVTVEWPGVLDSRRRKYRSPFTVTVGGQKPKIDVDVTCVVSIPVRFAAATLVSLKIELGYYRGRQSTFDLIVRIPLRTGGTINRRIPVTVDGREPGR